MVRVSEGKYRIGDTKVLIFVRVSTVFITYSNEHIFIDSKRVSVSNRNKKIPFNIQDYFIDHSLKKFQLNSEINSDFN